MNISPEWTTEERLAIIAALTFSDRQRVMKYRKPPEHNSESLLSIAVMPAAFLEQQRASLEQVVYRAAGEWSSKDFIEAARLELAKDIKKFFPGQFADAELGL